MGQLAHVGGVARVVYKGTANGVAVVNVFHVRNGPEPGLTYSDAGVQALAAAMATAWQNNIVSNLNTSYLGGSCEVTDLTDDTGAFGQASLSLSGSGTGTGTPASAACCVTWKINRHYRGGHPRTYLGPLSAANFSSPTTLSAGFVTTIQSSARGFRTAVNAITIESHPQTLICVHRHQHGVELAIPLRDDITDAVVDNRIDSMRRRLGRDR